MVRVYITITHSHSIAGVYITNQESTLCDVSPPFRRREGGRRSDHDVVELPRHATWSDVRDVRPTWSYTRGDPRPTWSRTAWRLED